MTAPLGASLSTTPPATSALDRVGPVRLQVRGHPGWQLVLERLPQHNLPQWAWTWRIMDMDAGEDGRVLARGQHGGYSGLVACYDAARRVHPRPTRWQRWQTRALAVAQLAVSAWRRRG